MVSAIDINLALSNYQMLTDNFEGLDHYFMLDKNNKVIMHSDTPYILREGIDITQIEFGVTEKQRDSNHDNVPIEPIEPNEETKWFEKEVLK